MGLWSTDEDNEEEGKDDNKDEAWENEDSIMCSHTLH